MVGGRGGARWGPLSAEPVPYADTCADCGADIEHHHGHGDARCPACFEKQLYDIDAGFLENYRKFGCRSRLTVAETCLRGLVLAAPDHRKVLAMTIFEQYVLSMSDLAGLFLAFRNREQAPIMKSFMEFKLDAASALDFFESVQSMGDYQLCAVLGLPMPFQIEARVSAPRRKGSVRGRRCRPSPRSRTCARPPTTTAPSTSRSSPARAPA